MKLCPPNVCLPNPTRIVASLTQAVGSVNSNLLPQGSSA
jgi:hypothetical protein